MSTAPPQSAAAPLLPYLPRRLPSYGQFTEALRCRGSLTAYLSDEIPDHDHMPNYQSLTNSDFDYHQVMLSQREIMITRRFTLPYGQFPVVSNFNDHDYWSPAPRPNDGLPEEVIARLILKRAACEKVAADEGEVCVVCLDDLHQGEDRPVVVLGCGHDFHGDCIGKWLHKKNACPLCRAIAIEKY